MASSLFNVIIVFGLLAISCVRCFNETEPDMTHLTAGWIDPESEEFAHSNLRHVYERDGPCTCPSVFAPNTYTGAAFPSALISALEYAQCMWSCVLTGITPGIKMRVNNIQTSGNVLASAGPYFTSTNGALFTPCALQGGACSIAIEMNIDPDAVSYYFGTDGYVGYSQYDFVTVVMHELGHGFGFSGFINPASGGYSLSSPQYVGIDRKVKYNSQYPWSTNPPTSTYTASQAVVSNALYFQGNSFTPRLYAPNPAQPGSSIYHFDESTYPRGDPDSLMTPVIYNGEANHVPGRMMCDLLNTIGYNIADITVCGVAPTGSTSSRTPTPTRTPTRGAPSASATRSAAASPSPSPSQSAAQSASASVSNVCPPCVCY